jgi:cyclopropane-fatty-acyl-phospholipid synthase
LCNSSPSYSERSSHLTSFVILFIHANTLISLLKVLDTSFQPFDWGAERKMNVSVQTFLQRQFDKRGLKISLNGDQPWDIQVHDWSAMLRAFLRGSLGLGEAYMDGVWDCERIDELFYRIAGGSLPVFVGLAIQTGTVFRMGKQSYAYRVGQSHYDLGNDLYQKMLDKRMTYTCAYWDNGAKTLDEAQEHKLALTAAKLHLEPGMSVLDIGSGWGSFIGYLAEKFGVRATGLTVSKEQAAYANERYKDLPVTTLIEDYRAHSPREKYDRIVSLGMFEHVGGPAHRIFFETSRRLMKDSGLLMLHTIGIPGKRERPEPWMAKYIFPNSEIPDPVDIACASRGLLRLENAQNLGGPNYSKTLMCWLSNFDAGWDSLDHSHYDERFRRMWRLYLAASAGNMRAGNMDVWQFVYSKLKRPVID